MSNLSDLIPAGGGQNNTDFTASGAIAAGKPVILNSAGTVTQVAETANGAAGTPANFESATTERTSSTFDSNSNSIQIATRLLLFIKIWAMVLATEQQWSEQ